MATVYCAAIECKHNKGNRCKARKIRLSEGHVHTVWNGVEQVWRCKEFEMSYEAKRMEAEIMKIMGADEK